LLGENVERKKKRRVRLPFTPGKKKKKSIRVWFSEMKGVGRGWERGNYFCAIRKSIIVKGRKKGVKKGCFHGERRPCAGSRADLSESRKKGGGLITKEK